MQKAYQVGQSNVM